MPKTPLRVVTPTQPPAVDDPPLRLGPEGRGLWDRVLREYDIDDVGGREILAQACSALDRAEALRKAIEKQGEVVKSRAGLRAHPAIKEELAARGFVCRQLSRLGLNLEPVQNVGRPAGMTGRF
jgi:hypothetical protein